MDPQILHKSTKIKKVAQELLHSVLTKWPRMESYHPRPSSFVQKDLPNVQLASAPARSRRLRELKTYNPRY